MYDMIRVNDYGHDYESDSCFDSGQSFSIIIVG